MRKVLLLDDVFPTGEQTMQPAIVWHNGRAHYDAFGGVTKHAAEAADFIKHVVPEPGKTHLLVLALGSEEAYGPNRNGDGFPERPVPAKHTKIGKSGESFWVAPGEELTKHYKTFEKGHAFQHHQNKDPAKASGYVKKAFWNEKMHRVELLIVVDNKKDPEWVSRVNDGEFPAVSMGCFLEGTLVTLADGTRKPIEKITVGDMVRTHLGRARKVTETHQRPYKGAIYSIHAEAHETVHCTAEHPFHVVKRADVKSKDDKATFRWDKTAQLQPAWLHAECIDQQETLLLEPIDQETATPDYVTRAFARLFGYYLAEGHVLRNREKEIFAIELTTHENDAIHGEIEQLCREFGTRNAPVTTVRRNCPVARSILICDPRLALLCYEHGGGYAKLKRLSAEALHWHPDLQREILGSYANGDGCGSADGSLKLSTGSSDLAWQWISLLPRLGICASISCLQHKAGGGFNVRATDEWVIHIGKQWAQTLRSVCAKIKSVEILSAKNSRRIVGDQIVTPIRDIDALYAETTVYNLEVEEDNSFVAAGLAVHNCRIKYDVCSRCGNKAPSRATYCDHAKYALNQVNDDGTKNYVHNPSPNFFDISRVFRPADRTGYTLKKVAHVYDVRSSAELGELATSFEAKSATLRKLSDIDKVVRGENVGSSSNVDPEQQKVIRKFRQYILPRMDVDQPMALLDKISGYAPGVVFASLQKLGMELTTRECVQYMMSKLAGANTRLDEATLDRAVLAQPHVFELFAESPALLDKIAATGILSPTTPDDALVGALSPLRHKRAGMLEMMYRNSVPDSVGIRPEEAPTTDVLTHTDPVTGRTYQTSRGAALQAQDLETRNHFMKQVGGAGLMAGAYKMLGSHPLVALGTGALGFNMLRSPKAPPALQTNEGPAISDYTEFAPYQQRTASLVMSLVRDYQSVRTVGPEAFNGLESLLPYVKEGSVEDVVTGLDLDLDIVALVVGQLISS